MDIYITCFTIGTKEKFPLKAETQKLLTNWQKHSIFFFVLAKNIVIFVVSFLLLSCFFCAMCTDLQSTSANNTHTHTHTLSLSLSLSLLHEVRNGNKKLRILHHHVDFWHTFLCTKLGFSNVNEKKFVNPKLSAIFVFFFFQVRVFQIWVTNLEV